MHSKPSIANGRHLAAARTLAELKQTELAVLAGLHVNSLKRLERMIVCDELFLVHYLMRARDIGSAGFQSHSVTTSQRREI